MNKLHKNEYGFGAFEAILVVIIVILAGVAGWYVYKDHQKTTTNTAKSLSQSKTTSGQQLTQKFVAISAWGVRVPYSGSDTLSVTSQSCAENGDANGDTVNLGCQVAVNSKDLAEAVGSCQSKLATTTVGYFYRMGAKDNYNETNGSGFEPVAQWAAENPGQFTKIGSYYYAFAPIGAAWGGSGADTIKTSNSKGLADTTPAGCGNWITEYNTVEPSIKALASRFETVQG